MTDRARQVMTVTLNPALDVSTSTETVGPEHKMRCVAAVREPGGGGINVARVADRLGVPPVAVVLSGGATGRQIADLTRAEGLDVRSIEIGGETRQSFSVFEDSTGEQYRFVLPGPPIDGETIEAVLTELRGAARPDGRPIVVISGSVPPGLPSGALSDLVAGLSFADVIVDTSGPALAEASRSPLLLVKPSVRELGDVVGRSLESVAEVVAAAREMVERRPLRCALVSLGGDGAVLVVEGRPAVRLEAPEVAVRSAVGAGDSLVGGVAVGLARQLDEVEAAKLGVAAGSAAVITKGSGLCNPDDVDRLLPLVTATEISG